MVSDSLLRRSLLVLPLLTLVVASSVLAQADDVRQQPDRTGKVFVDGRWLTPERASEAGYFEYHRRWFPASMRKTLAKWEKQDKKHEHWLRARRYTSKHYRVVTNVPRFIYESDIKPFLDELYRAYTRVFKEKFRLQSKAANKKFIYIHDGFEDFAVNNPAGGGPRPRNTPGFIRGGSELVVYWDDTEPETFYHTCFHEGAHQFVHAMLPGAKYPKWINEALATYFEGCSYSPITRKIDVNFLPPVRLLHAQRLLKTKAGGRPKWTLLDVITAPDNAFNANHYALSWSFTYFMTHARDKAMRKRYLKFLKVMNGAGVKHTPRQIFTRILKVDPIALGDEWRQFVLGLPSAIEMRRPVLNRVRNNDADLDLQDGDVVRSLDHRPVKSARQFNRLVKERPRDRAVRLLVVRRTPVAGPMRYKARLVEVVIPPDSKIELVSMSSLPGNASFRP